VRNSILLFFSRIPPEQQLFSGQLKRNFWYKSPESVQRTSSGSSCNPITMINTVWEWRQARQVIAPYFGNS